MGLLARIKMENDKTLYNECIRVFETWIKTLGTITDHTIHTERNGDVEFTKKNIIVDDCEINDYTLLFVQEKGFLTVNVVFIKGENTIIDCDFYGESTKFEITPFTFDIRTPGFVEQLFYLNDKWKLDDFPIYETMNANTRADAVSLLNKIQEQKRNLPIIVISDTNSRYKNMRAYLGKSTRFIGIIAFINNIEAEDEFNKIMGYDLGCFNESVRMYKPTFGLNDSKFRHALWTKNRVEAIGEIEVGNKLRRVLQKNSVENIQFPNDYSVIQKKHIDGISKEITELDQDRDYYHKLYDMQVQINDEMRDQIARLEKEISRLASLVMGLKDKYDYRADDDRISQEDIETVNDAYEYSKQEYSKYLFWGGSIGDGISKLNPEAGPPNKVVLHLSKLYELSIEIFERGYEGNPKGWLNSRGVKCSGEDQTDRDTKEEVKKRTFKDNLSESYFDSHTKVNDGTTHDKCVRIYFKINKEKKLILIGWIGPHP